MQKIVFLVITQIKKQKFIIAFGRNQYPCTLKCLYMKPGKSFAGGSITLTVTFVKGKKHIHMCIKNTKLTDWVDKQEIQSVLHVSNRTLQYMRTRKQIPFSTFGGKVLYYEPGIVALIEESAIV